MPRRAGRRGLYRVQTPLGTPSRCGLLHRPFFAQLLIRRPQQPHRRLYPLHVVPNPHVLVERMLVVVSIHERHDDERRAEDFDEAVGGDAAAHHADADGVGAGGGFDQGVVGPFAEGRFEWGARGAAGGAHRKGCEFVVGGAVGVGGFAFDQVVALLLDVFLQEAEQVFGRSFRHGAQVELGDGLVRDDVRGLVADGRRGHAAHVERGVLQGLLVSFADELGGLDAGAAADGGFVVAGVGQDFLFGVGEFYFVVVAGNGDAPLVVFHRGDKAGQADGGGRNVVAVVAAVQRPLRAVDGGRDARGAAIAEDEGRALARVARAVVDDNGVGGEQIAVRFYHRRNLGRALFLFAVEEHLHVDDRVEARFLQAVEGGEEHHDRPLVVGR